MAQYLEKLIAAMKKGLNDLLAQGILDLNEESPAQDQKQEEPKAPLSGGNPQKRRRS